MIKSCVLIYSGGLDSTALLYSLIKMKAEVVALSFNYGQRHVKELAGAAVIARKAGVKHHVIDLSPLGMILQSNLTDNSKEVPEGHYAEESMKATVVPNRNMIMLSIAIGHAISLKYNHVAYAAHGGDHTIYPDCRPEFVDKMDSVARICDWRGVKIYAPFLKFTKAECVKVGVDSGAPLGLTWSCYKGLGVHCGKCGSCTERKEAFKVAGVEDPTEYSA